MISEQPEKYVYCENKNNQSVIFFLTNLDCFWIKI